MLAAFIITILTRFAIVTAASEAVADISGKNGPIDPPISVARSLSRRPYRDRHPDRKPKPCRRNCH
jgi:hypothetical protein